MKSCMEYLHFDSFFIYPLPCMKRRKHTQSVGLKLVISSMRFTNRYEQLYIFLNAGISMQTEWEFSDPNDCVNAMGFKGNDNMPAILLETWTFFNPNRLNAFCL